MQLIRAKLHPPRLSPNLVPRPRLVQQLNAGMARKLSLVSAPAGFGKTTLLSEWVQQASCPAAWVSLDSNDDDLHRFLTYFVAAINTVFSHSCTEIQSLLNVQTLPPTTSVVGILANELAMLDGEMILVLDDYHAVQQIEIHNLIDRLITYLPPTFHLVLGTRSSPPLSLVNLRAQGQLCELRQPHLRFTLQETGAFFHREGEMALDQRVLEELDRHTEGWPAGLRLLLLSMAGEDDLRSVTARFTLGEVDIMSYLAEQVLAKQSAALQHFLLSTAIVERFTLSLYAQLAPEKSVRDEDEALLSICLRDNLFVVALGEGWYRYHPLFRELLLHRQERQIGRHALAEQHRRASGWLEQKGFIDDAIRHAFLAGDEGLAIAVLNRHRIEAMGGERWSQLERWLALFPRTLIESHPILTVTQAWIFMSSETDVAHVAAMKRLERHLADEKTSLDSEMRRMMVGELNVMISEKAFARGDLQATLNHAKRAFELLPVHHSHARAANYVLLIGSLLYAGNSAQAEEILQIATDEERLHNKSFARWIAIPRFIVDFIPLKLKDAERTAMQVKVLAQQHKLMESLCWANYYLGRIAYLENRLDDARHYFDEVLANRFAARYTPASDTFLCLALTYHAQGMPQAAIEITEEIAETLQLRGAGQIPLVVLSLKAHLALLQGRPEEAIAWAAQVGRVANYSPLAWSQIVPFTVVRILLAEGSAKSLEEAGQMLPVMQQIASTAGSLLHRTQLLVFEAVLHDRLGAQETALAKLGEAITIAEPSRAIRLFADLGIESDCRVHSLLLELDKQSESGNFARQVWAALSVELRTPLQVLPSPHADSPQPVIPPRGFIDHLTSREIEILVLIDKGYSNKQIADALFISYKTVENHTTSIYQKLEVRSRMQAVRRAKELHLLPQD